MIVNQHTAFDDRSVSKVWITDALRGQAATFDRLRVDRQLEEALTRGPDPLHLAAAFGLDDKTVIRYTNGADRSSRPSRVPQRLVISIDPGDLLGGDVGV